MLLFCKKRMLKSASFDADPNIYYRTFFCDPVGVRTLDLLIRSQSLYPAELPSHDEEYSRNGTSTPPFLAGAEGIEPSTNGFGDRYSTS